MTSQLGLLYGTTLDGMAHTQIFLFLSLESEKPYISALIDSVSGEGCAWAACCCFSLCPHMAEKEIMVSSLAKKC